MTEAQDTALGESPPQAVVSVDRVSVRYSRARRPALEHVSLHVRPGEVAVLLGANGSGKSTLLRVVAGIVSPSEGSVRVLGQGVRGVDRRLFARLVAFMPQSEGIAIGFRVREVVGMGRAPHQSGWLREGVEDVAAVEDAIARCDLGALSARRVEELSAGEQRRVSLARALAQRPRVLLLDEPAAFLDVRHRVELHELLADVAERAGVACVIAMHELDAAAHLASHILLLREGTVVAAGTPDEVMTSQSLRRAFDAEVDVSTHEPSGRRYFVVRSRRTGSANWASPNIGAVSKPSPPQL